MDSSSQRKVEQVRSLLKVEERLFEASFFLERLVLGPEKPEIDYNLNAFISACRPITLILQKEMKGVTGFKSWWETRREILRKDRSAKFFLNIRNHSLHAGKISLVGSVHSFEDGFRWRYYFAGGEEKVPEELLYKELTHCCADHLSKMAKIVLDCINDFPFNTSLEKVFTIQGLKFLNLEMDDVLPLLGYPKDFIAGLPKGSTSEGLAYFRKTVDKLNILEIEKISELSKNWKIPEVVRKVDDKFTKHLIDRLEAGKQPDSPYKLIGEAIMRFEKKSRK